MSGTFQTLYINIYISYNDIQLPNKFIINYSSHVNFLIYFLSLFFILNIGICSNIEIWTSIHYINFIYSYLLSYTKSDDGWLKDETSLFNSDFYSTVLCVRLIQYTNFSLSSNTVLIYKKQCQVALWID